jgi:hypothetical protein
VHFIWKVAEKGFKSAFMMNKLAMINSCEIQVCTILVCALYSIKYGNTIGTNGSYLELIIFI